MNNDPKDFKIYSKKAKADAKTKIPKSNSKSN